MSQNEDVIADIPCNAQGLIWVDDTTAAGYPSRLQKQFDQIGRIMPKFTIRPFVPFRNRARDQWGVPCDCRLIEHKWDDSAGMVRDQRWGSGNGWAFDISGLRRCAPCNNHCLADLFLRYTAVDDGRIVPDWDASHQYFSAMRLDDLESRNMLAKPRGRREKGVVALVEERSGLVLPLPSGCVVSWLYFGDGSGVEIAVYDGIAMRDRMNRYPEYFDTEVVLNEDDVERDIAGCLDVIEKLEQGFFTQDDLLNNMPRYPFAQSHGGNTNLKERN
ncbi:hypothetical protein DSM100688_1882 [Bifidobacterium ramosum]|uniref:Uncharacterized protein n=1 Tax=Bifidobacterium ramosum TaxID=1798158 RepID=A0A6L4WYM5_9BIFI|nr:hypothetical protein DSM100688_1882 [Bifidobacterium ramosum]